MNLAKVLAKSTTLPATSVRSGLAKPTLRTTSGSTRRRLVSASDGPGRKTWTVQLPGRLSSAVLTAGEAPEYELMRLWKRNGVSAPVNPSKIVKPVMKFVFESSRKP